VIGVYIHIPFCRTRCPYCDFFSTAIPGAVPSDYVNALCREILGFPKEGEEVGAVFIGGGTPSLLTRGELSRLLDCLNRKFLFAGDAEITIEANPDDVELAVLRSWRRMGVNRLSLGVQSFNDFTLRYLGRRHNAAAAFEACRAGAEHFSNWGMDLIFGAPPVEAWPDTLEQCVELAPNHVSTYGLTYEPGTQFEARAGEAVDDETWLQLYRQAEANLSEYRHYEISNYALPGYECRHNLIYWRNEPYAGFGAGAYSFIDGVRARNAADVERYVAKPGTKEESVELTPREIRVETLIQHFRLLDGLEKAAYAQRFGQEVRPEFSKPLDDLVKRGLLWENEERIAPTQLGFELNNEIGLELVGT